MSDFKFDMADFANPDAFVAKVGVNQTNRDVQGKAVPLKTTRSQGAPKSTMSVVSISEAAMNTAVFKPEGVIKDAYTRVGQDVIAAGISEYGGPEKVLGGAMQFSPTDLILKAENMKIPPPDFGLGGAAPTSPVPIDPGGASVSGQGWAMPINAPVRVTSDFGPRRPPVPGASSYHKGLDLDGDTGDPIKASKPGKVTKAGVGSGYGNVVYIDHGDGTSSRYAHLSSIAVKVGDQVMMNQVVGGMGKTGNVSGVHLHFEIHKDGAAIDPAPLLGL